MTVRGSTFVRSTPMPSLLPGLSRLLLVGLLAGCARQQPVAAATPVCPDPAQSGARPVVQPAPLVTAPLRLAAPWAPAAAVEKRPLVTSQVVPKSVAEWKDAELGLGLAMEPATLPGTMRGFLFSAVYPNADPPPYSFTGPSGATGTAYFVSDGRGVGFVKGFQRRLTDGSRLLIDGAQLPPGVANPWKLSRPLHLVDLEVNGGRGDATKDQLFVITNARVLDGSEVLPIDLGAAMTALSARAADRFKALEGAAARTQKNVEAELPVGTQRDTREEWPAATGSRLTWDDAKREISLVHVQRRKLRYEAPPRPLPVRCAPGAPCQQQVEYPVFEVEVVQAVRQVVSANGVLMEETVYQPRATQNRVQ